MRMVWMAAAGAAMALAGCEPLLDGIEVGQAANGLEYPVLERNTYRAWAASFQTAPFANGAVSVVAREGDFLRTFSQVPCQGGAAVCSPSGRVGHLELTPDYAVVSGLYGRTFWLSPGGDGALVRGAVTVPLAWN